jgi:hypothetical protein
MTPLLCKFKNYRLNYIFTSIFIAEFALKMIALSPVGYMRDKMNVFDGVIVLFSIIDLSKFF